MAKSLPVQLPSVKPFDPKGEPATITQRWARWRKGFEYFLQASGITDDGQKRSMLLHMVGEEVQEIYESIPPVTGQDPNCKIQWPT